MSIVDKERAIKSIVSASVSSFAVAFKDRHIEEHDDPEGTINMKIHNVFIAVLGSDIQYYTALARSLDSSLGNMLEAMAIEIAKLSYVVDNHVKGKLFNKQTEFIADLLEKYKRHERHPQIEDYLELRNLVSGNSFTKRHESDYYLIDEENNQHYLIELKIGGDLDNKKARAEKEAILEQYCILSNTLSEEANISIKFATAYNRFGENKGWKQERVKQFFADDELLIGRDFWNFICKSQNGYELVLNAYREKAPELKDALEEIKHRYLG